jgi:hypothetical protein
MKDLLFKQITDGDNNTLSIILSKLDDKIIKGLLSEKNLQILEDSKPDFALKQGMLIRAKKDLRGVSNSYNTPERIDILKGTILILPSEGTNRGDVFTTIYEGECIIHLRGLCEGEKKKLDGSCAFSKIGLSEGVKTSYPCDLGMAQKDCWEIF